MNSTRRRQRQYVCDLRGGSGQGAYRARSGHPEPARARLARIAAQACRVVPSHPAGPAEAERRGGR